VLQREETQEDVMLFFLNSFTALKAETTYLRVLLLRPITNQGCYQLFRRGPQS